MAIRGNIIAVDFDGTVVTHEYPYIGEDAGAVEVLKELIANDNRLILLTMRSGALLERAKQWFADHQIPLWAINENPEQGSWTKSSKVYANLYIDDSNLGCPLKIVESSIRPVADWVRIRQQLVLEGYLDE